MTRQSYSIHSCNSALYGKTVVLSDRLHTDLLVLADTLPYIEAYEVYYPSFTYFEGKKEKEGNFPLAVRFRDGHAELWASTWLPVKPEKTIERARHAHAESLGATYVLRTLRDLEDNPIEICNRRTMQTFLFRGMERSTEALETQILESLATGAKSLASLAKSTDVAVSVAQLAVFRLIRAARVSAPICQQFVSPAWIVKAARYENA